jgi:hypothetical protein
MSAVQRLTEWASSVTISAQSYRPTYANPGELKADILEVLEKYKSSLSYRESMEGLPPGTLTEKFSECLCAYEDVDWNGQWIRHWFHEPECEKA